MKDMEFKATEALRHLLEQVPLINRLQIEQPPQANDYGIDILVRMDVAGRPHSLVCEVKPIGQPRFVRVALLELRDYVTRQRPDATPVLIAPYLSPESQALCRNQEVGFLDLEGNARLIFDNIFVERQVTGKPITERRELRSLFKPKSAQVLRVMLRNPHQAWRVAELAKVAGVSVGHVSNVRASLLDREWAQLSREGLFLSNPNALLDEWRDKYDPPEGTRMTFYTTLHGSAFEQAARQVLSLDGNAGLAAFSSFSAAQWLAPYGRTGTHYFYADESGLQRLKSALRLSAAQKGENVVVTVVAETGLFGDMVEPAPGAVCTSPVQTYLDLCITGERGREAADHLRREKLLWPK